jgi:DNA repair exonuclease SbcCD ATPase subunit
MRLVFKKIKFKNFLSSGNTYIEVDLNSHNKTIIFGLNGHGKSMILCALTYVLFGKAFRKINKPNIPNSINKKDCLVEIEFSIGSKDYKIIRGMKPNIFEIYIDDVLLTQDAVNKDYQEYLESNILKMNYKSFIQVDILGSARYTPFMQLSAADRRAVIEDLLDIQIFSSMNVLVKEKVSNIKSSLSELKSNIEVHKEKINSQNNLIKEIKKNSESHILKKKESVKKYENEIEKLNSDVVLIEQHVKVLQNSILDKTSSSSKKQKLIQMEAKLENNISNFTKELNFYSSNDSCPTCKQVILPEFKKENVTSIESKKEKLEEGYVKLKNEIYTLEGRLNEISDISDKIIDHNNEITKINTKINSYKDFIKNLNLEIENIEGCSVVSEEDINKLRELVFEYEVFVSQQKKLSEDKKYLEYCATLLKDGGIKTKIIKQYLPILNKRINTYLSKLNFFVNFNINENFEEVIKSRHRDEFQYNNFSEGQKLRIDLALLFAFRDISKMKNSVDCNLLFMDEIVDGSFDEPGIDLFLDMLGDLDYNTNIFVISPKGEEIKDRFDRALKFEMVKNFSRLKVIQ